MSEAPPLDFRDARRDDVPVILELCYGGQVIEGRFPPLDASDPAYARAFAAIDADPNQRLIVCESGGDVIGCMQISYLLGLPGPAALRGQLENIHVRADRRGAGVGAAMVEWAVGQCRAQGCSVVQLTSNKKRTEAHRFYGRMGFKATHEGFKRTL